MSMTLLYGLWAGVAGAAGQDSPGAQEETTDGVAPSAGPAADGDAVDCSGWNTGEFFHAAAPPVVAACLARGSDPHAQDDWGRAPLHIAAGTNEHPSVTEALLAADANPNTRDRVFEITFASAHHVTYGTLGLTPLHHAAQSNANPAVIEALVAGGAQINARAHRGWTPLHYAASQNRNPAVTQALIAGGADVNARNRYRITPLILAASARHQPEREAVISALLDGGADPLPGLHRSAGCAEWNTRRFFEFAVPQNVAACLAEHSDPNARDARGDTPLHHAVRTNFDAGVTQVLLEAGAQPNPRNNRGEAPLHLAVAHNPNEAVIEALTAARANPNVWSDRGLTALHYAAQYNASAEVFRALYAAGAHPNVLGRLGTTPLHHAVSERDDVAAATALIAGGADVDARDSRGNTPLHTAAEKSLRSDRGAVITVLLDAGASPVLRNVAGQTPWDIVQNHASLNPSEALRRLEAAHRAAGAD